MGALAIHVGNGGNNYNVTMVNNTAGVTNPLPISIAAVSNTKTYDGTTGTAATPVLASGSLVGGDTFTTLAESYAAKNAGTNLTLTPLAVINDSNSGNNYAVTAITNTSGVIDKAALLLIPNLCRCCTPLSR